MFCPFLKKSRDVIFLFLKAETRHDRVDVEHGRVDVEHDRVS